MLPSALLTASAYAILTDFGAESSRPASLLCTLRTHQSPGEWQHSLPACSLALARRDFHPLDFFKWFPPPSLLVPPLPRFPQRDRSHSYVSLESALNHWGVSTQSPVSLTCVTTGKPKEYRTPEFAITLRTISEHLFWGSSKSGHVIRNIELANQRRLCLTGFTSRSKAD